MTTLAASIEAAKALRDDPGRTEEEAEAMADVLASVRERAVSAVTRYAAEVER